jgi:predicted DNA-binding transcriptional regulator YafY
MCTLSAHNASNMSINKNALIRYQALDRCFRNTGRMYFWEDLLEECNKALMEFDSGKSGIQRRQLFDDITFMESDQGWSIPLQRLKYGKKTYYQYGNSSFSINNQPVNHSEAEQIKSALQIFSRFSGTPQFEWVNEMIPMLETKFGLIERKKSVISLESNWDLKGLHFLTPLFNAIVNERVLTVYYQDFKSHQPYAIDFHPYHLRQFNNRWFAFGLNAEKGISTWNMALDRIVSLQETNHPYEPSNVDWEDYFYDMVGVSRPYAAEIQSVVLRFNAESAPYVITKPLHPSQRHKSYDNGIDVEIKVIPNFELERLILSYGETVQVMAPIYLKERIAMRLRLARSNYDIT